MVRKDSKLSLGALKRHLKPLPSAIHLHVSQVLIKVALGHVLRGNKTIHQACKRVEHNVPHLRVEQNVPHTIKSGTKCATCQCNSTLALPTSSYTVRALN
jgi:hypothetical protein